MEYECPDCSYKTTKRYRMNDHRPGDKCRIKTSKELREKNREAQEKAQKEKKREYDRQYQERKRKKAKVAEANAKFKELRA